MNSSDELLGKTKGFGWFAPLGSAKISLITISRELVAVLNLKLACKLDADELPFVF